MKIAQLVSLALVSFCLSFSANAQSKIAKQADEEFANGGYVLAEKDYQTALASIKELDVKARVLFQIAECRRLSMNFAASYEYYDKAITAQYYKQSPEVYFNYGTALQESEKWEEAQVQYNKYVEKGGDKSKANARIASCKDAAIKKAGKTRVMVENLTELNTPFFDYSLVYASKKGDEMVFSSSRQSAVGSAEDPRTGESFMDLFSASRDKKGKFGVPTPLGTKVNTPSNEGTSCFSKDFGTLYFTLCRFENEERFACDIYTSERSGTNYDVPVQMVIVDRETDDSSMVGHPCLSPDDKFFLFASDMPGGKGGKDIWGVSYDKKNERMGKPVNLSINTSGDEMFPFIADDGTLYFSSNGHNGLGGLDIFKAEKTGDLTYGTATNLGYPINTSSDDFSLIMEKGNPDIKFSGFFTSNRPGGKGKDDIYYFKEPAMEFALIGTVYDEETGTPISGSDVTVLASNGDNFKLTSDGNGGFSLEKDKLKGNVTYTVDVAKKDYIGTGDKFSTVGLKESTTFAREYFLKPIVIGKVYNLPEVRYDYTKADLQVNAEVNSKDSLNYLFDLMTKNPTFVIQLEAHTDARGDDKSNQDLAQRRAQSCVDYLVKEKGIATERIVPVGLGEKEPRTLEKDMAGFHAGDKMTEAFINALKTDAEKEAAHQLNRRTVFKILRTDFVPKK